MSKNDNTVDKSVTKSESDVRALGTFTNRRNIINKYVLVEKGIANDNLVELAKKLHRNDPEANFWFVDDDSKSEEMIQWIKAYEKGEAQLPIRSSTWMGDHFVGNLQQYLARGHQILGARKRNVGRANRED